MSDVPTRPITAQQLAALLQEDRPPGSRLDLTSYDLSGLSLQKMSFTRVRFSNYKSLNCRTLKQTDFSGATFHDCDFSGAELVSVAFRNARLLRCDLRYTCFRSSAFTQAKLIECDLYRANFEGNNIFEHARVENCSLHLISLAGADIRLENLQDAIVQRDPVAFARFLDHYGFVDKTQIPHFAALGKLEAAGIYRELSGLWAGKGFLGDATEAYVRAKRLERSCQWPSFVWKAAEHRKQLGRIDDLAAERTARKLTGSAVEYLELLAMDFICAFGSSVARVLLTIVLTVFLFAGVYRFCNAVTSTDGPGSSRSTFGTCAAYSSYKIIAGDPGAYHVLPRFEWLAATETGLGIGLIGLFGFVLGNSIRNT